MINTKPLKGGNVFKIVLRKGKYESGKFITIYILKSKKDNDNYLGICVSKKHGNSVVRNKLKRWVREGYTNIEQNIEKGFNIIVLYKKNIEIEKLTYNVVKDEISKLLNKAGMFYENNT